MNLDFEASLWAPLERPGVRADHLLAWDGGEYTRWSWEDWRDRSLRLAGGLARLGIRPGDRVACLLTNSPDACAGVFGVWFAGACLLSLPLISRGMEAAEYVAQLRRIVRQSEPVLLVCDQSFLSLIDQAQLGVRTASFQQLDAPRSTEPTLIDSNSPAFVQYTSGSTTEPRGCVLTPRAIVHQVRLLERSLDIDAEHDVGVVWLPLSHDMGLFGCLLVAYWVGSGLVLSTPERFLTQPASWLGDCARFKATISAAPSFALDLATRIASRRLPGPIPMRRLVLGGERVDAGTLRRATQLLGEERLRPSALKPAYGLAEAVLAVSMTPLEEEPTVLELDAGALTEGQIRAAPNHRENDRAAGVALVSAGPPLPGNFVRIKSEGRVGEIMVKTPSLAEGYLNAPQATAERFTAEGLRSSDLGFVDHGNVYITGRMDDLMTIAGRNIYARDLEASMSRVAGLRPGGYSIVDVDNGGAARLVAVVEPRSHHPDLSVMAANITAAVRASAGIMVDECLFVDRGQLPKTPSGKVQRFRCRELASEGPGEGRVSIRS